jgi:hypothetical protein
MEQTINSARRLNDRGVADAFLELISDKLVKLGHHQQTRSSFIIVLSSLFMAAEAAARAPPLSFLNPAYKVENLLPLAPISSS